MEAIKEIGSIWQGSIMTLSYVAEQIKERFGDEAVKIYDPRENCFTYNRWRAEGYQVKKGEKAIKSITWVKKTDEKTGKVYKFPRTVNLFFISQVEPITK